MTTKNFKQQAREVSEKKRYLSELLAQPVEAVASECLPVLNNHEQLDNYLKQAIHRVPYCKLIYVTDRNYQQLSANIMPDNIDASYRGQILAQRPYLQATIPLKGLVLSNVYECSNTSQKCITLVQAIQKDNQLLGLLLADFNLHELPVPNKMLNNWHQFKGDPAIRGSLFSQRRVNSLLDMQIDKVHEVVQALMFKNGVFHFKLHYSSSRVTLWLYDEPHHYRLHSIDDLLNGSVFSCYRQQQYPDKACVNSEEINQVLTQFSALRFADENVYLRSGSVNIINGMVGLNFSCDGSHYIPVKEFIENSIDYWLGSLKTA